VTTDCVVVEPGALKRYAMSTCRAAQSPFLTQCIREYVAMAHSMQVHVADSHLYPGCAVRIAGLPAPDHEAVATVEFADGSGTQATCHRLPTDEIELMVEGYTTLKRHPVNARHWLLLPVDANRETWCVKRRLP